MPTFPAFTVTALGLDMQAQAETGKTLTFSRIALGAGAVADPSAATALADQRMTSNVQQITTMVAGSVRVRAVFTNADLAVGFSITEVGVFALDPTTHVEKLHSYTKTTTPDYMPSSAAPATVEQIFDAIIAIGGATSVTAVIDDTVMIATKRDVEDSSTVEVSGGIRVGEAGGLLAGQIARLHTDGKVYVAGVDSAAGVVAILGAVMEDAALNALVRCRRAGAALLVADGGCTPAIGADCYLATSGAVSHAVGASYASTARRIGIFLTNSVVGGKVLVWIQIERPMNNDRRIVYDADVTAQTSVALSGLTSAKRYRLHIGGVQATLPGIAKLQPNGSDANCQSFAYGNSGAVGSLLSYLTLGKVGKTVVTGIEVTIGPRVGGASAYRFGLRGQGASDTDGDAGAGFGAGGTTTDFTSLTILFTQAFTGHVLVVEEPR